MQNPHFSVPGEDAPLEELYWAEMSHGMAHGNPVQLSDKVRQRLLQYSEQKPGDLDDLLPLLPDDRATFARVKAIYDKNSATQGEDWNRSVRSYLETNGGYFHQELLAEARQAKDDDEMGSPENHEALERLTTVDWSLAEPLLNQFSAGRQPRTALLAKTLLYRHAISVPDEASAARMRTELQTVVADRKALGYSRATALESLLDTEWPGRDDWYLSLFHDPTLRKLRDGYQGFSTLTEPVRNAPDRWIPIMTRLVSDPDRAVHDNAVESLIQFQLREGRKDALEPLLPWLSDPKWSSADDRLRLIQSVPDLDMREAVLGLISVVGEEKGEEYERSYAAESLAHFRDPRAVPALRLALTREKGSDHRRRIIQGLIACGGVAPEEAAADVESFAQYTLTSEGQERWEKAAYSLGSTDLPAEIALGGYIAQQGPESDRTAELLVKRIDELPTSNPALAGRLQKLTSEWKSATADRAILRHLHKGAVTAADLASALDRRESMQKTVAPELKELESPAGFPSGIAAVLAADHEKELAILASSDFEAVEGLLAAARLVREKLPLAKVDALITPANPLSSRGRVLVKRYRFEDGDKIIGPATPEYWLADPVTGTAEIVKGEFAPFEEYTFRKLQPAQGPGAYWAAIPDRNANQTTIGIYDEENFSLQPVMTVPDVLFDSRHIWVDQQAGRLGPQWTLHLLKSQARALLPCRRSRGISEKLSSSERKRRKRFRPPRWSEPIISARLVAGGDNQRANCG
jgi:hypothetical protein